MTDITKGKALKPRELAAIEEWIGGSTLVEAWRKHIARNPEAPYAVQAAANWANQERIKDAVEKAREAVIAAQYGSMTGFITAQLAKFEKVFAEGITLRRDASGILRPESLPAALGAGLAISKLFQHAAAANMSKLAMLKIWTAIQSDLNIDKADRAEIERAIIDGGEL